MPSFALWLLGSASALALRSPCASAVRVSQGDSSEQFARDQAWTEDHAWYPMVQPGTIEMEASAKGVLSKEVFTHSRPIPRPFMERGVKYTVAFTITGSKAHGDEKKTYNFKVEGKGGFYTCFVVNRVSPTVRRLGYRCGHYLDGNFAKMAIDDTKKFKLCCSTASESGVPGGGKVSARAAQQTIKMEARTMYEVFDVKPGRLPRPWLNQGGEYLVEFTLTGFPNSRWGEETYRFELTGAGAFYKCFVRERAEFLGDSCKDFGDGTFSKATADLTGQVKLCCNAYRFTST